MIETIRIFRKKEDDIWALYIQEFFKFIGCIVCDCEVRSEHGNLINSNDEYDANIFLNIKSEEGVNEFWSDFERLGIKGEHFTLPDITITANQGIMDTERKKKVLQEIIERIWRTDPHFQEVKYLNEIYLENELFFYLYNEGNSKFIREHHSSSEKRKEIKEYLRKAALLSFDPVKTSCNKLYSAEWEELEALKTSGGKLPPYYSYAKIYMMYKLNELVMVLDNSQVFKIDTLLEMVEEVMKEYPDFIRLHYLAGSICRGDRCYFRDVEIWFLEMIQKMEKKGVKEMISFPYYRLGKFREYVMNNMENAYKCYEKAYEYNKNNCSVLLKLAEVSEDEECALLCNQIIDQLLNGYRMEQLMPKQQIFVYDSFVMLGDALRRIRDYQGAVVCYQNAVELAEKTSVFYEFFGEDTIIDFWKIVEASMPVESVLYKIIRCASEMNDVELVNRCFEKMSQHR